jgi:membrane-associated phospholipid phosphatase
MPRSAARSAVPLLKAWREDADKLDVAVYAAIAATPTPTLDVAFRRLSRAADHSKLWMAASAGMATRGGERERRAAVDGLTSVALTSAVVNLVLKPLGARRRPARARHRVPLARHVTMPGSTSWPSGHAASAFAFATAAGVASPPAAVPLTTLAALVAYSRVHTGVHYPLDVIAGGVTGVAAAPVGIAAADRIQRCGRTASKPPYLRGVQPTDASKP